MTDTKDAIMGQVAQCQHGRMKIRRDGLGESYPMPTRQYEKSDGTVWENPIPCQHGRMTNGTRVGLETRLIDRNDRGTGLRVPG
jgi:hypothetical protein